MKVWLIILRFFTKIFCVGCQTGWIGHEKRCYKFEQDPQDYSTAINRCNGKGGTLVTIHSDSQNAWLNSQISENQMDHHNYWIGFHSPSKAYEFVWESHG